MQWVPRQFLYSPIFDGVENHWNFVFLSCSGAQLQTIAGTHGDLRVYDVIDDAKRKSAEMKSETDRIKKKSTQNKTA